MPLPRTYDRTGQVGSEIEVIQLKAGLITDAPPLGAPEGSTKSESNFDLLRDGTRRRRRGIRSEGDTPAGQILANFTTTGLPTTSSKFASHLWRSVGTDSSLNVQVIKVGGIIKFYREGDLLLVGSWVDQYIDLEVYKTQEDVDVSELEVSLCSGNGILFVTGRYIEPLLVRYDATANDLVISTLDVYVRDFVGIDDGLDVGVKPANLTEQHRYNLGNRGWTYANIQNYYDGILADGAVGSTGTLDKYPAKNQIPFMAMVRYKPDSGVSSADVYVEDWTKKFDAYKLEAEIFGNTSAPQGRLKISPWDNTQGFSGANIGAEVAITDIQWMSSVVSLAGYRRFKNTITFRFFLDNSASVFQTGGRVYLNGNEGTYVIQEGLLPPKTKTINFGDHPYKIKAHSTTWIEITYPEYESIIYAADDDIKNSWADTELTVAYDGTTFDNPNGASINERPTVSTFWQGRLWLSGMETSGFSDMLLFSRIVTSDENDDRKYGEMFQNADPTSQFMSQVVPSDGGTIQIPGLAGVKALVPLQDSLIVLSTSGIWEVSGSGRDAFSANSISIRKIGDIEVTGPRCYAYGEMGLFVASPRGVYQVSPDQNSGYLSAKSLTWDKIQTLWNEIPNVNYGLMHLVIDPDNYKLYVFYPDSSDGSTPLGGALVFDIFHEAWTKTNYAKATDTYLLGVTCQSDEGITSNLNRLKYWVWTRLEPFQILMTCNTKETGYDDWAGESPAFLETTFLMGDDLARHKQAPVLTVFMRNTETGYDEFDEPVNTSSLCVQSRWDFANASTSNKYGNFQECFRKRFYLPLGPSDRYPHDIVVSRNKIRGRGRSLSLYFSTSLGRDAHLVGLSVGTQYERNA